MKNRLHDKKAGIAILVALIVISLAEVLFRSFVLKEAMLATANLGEQVAIIVLSAFIIIMTLKGKDRICYICYGAWLSIMIFPSYYFLDRYNYFEINSKEGRIVWQMLLSKSLLMGLRKSVKP